LYELQDALKRGEATLQLITHDVPANWQLFDLGDLHVGSVSFHEDAFLQVREQILQEKNSFVVLGGDLIEAIAVDDKRFDIDTVDPELTKIDKQVDKVVEILKPLKDRAIVSLQGNHEFKLIRNTDITNRICKELGIPNGTFSCKISYKDDNGLQFKHFTTHGMRTIKTNADDPIRRESNEKLSLKRHLKDLCGDAYLMTKHHVHKLILSDPEPTLFLVDDGRKVKDSHTHAKQTDKYIHPDLRRYGCAGAWMRLYGKMGTSSYAERAEYTPVEIGCLKFTIRDRQLVSGEKVIV
jgi:hypothetical protein